MPDLLIVDDDRDTCQFISRTARRRRTAGSTFESNPAEALATGRRGAVRRRGLRHQPQRPGVGARRPAGRAAHEPPLPGRAHQRVRHARDRGRGGARRRVRLHQQAVQHHPGEVGRRAGARPGRGPGRGAPRAGARGCLPGLIGRTAPMLEVYKQIAYAADAVAPVLIVGESGTGKELVARAIHDHGRRASKPVRRRQLRRHRRDAARVGALRAHAGVVHRRRRRRQGPVRAGAAAGPSSSTRSARRRPRSR